MIDSVRTTVLGLAAGFGLIVSGQAWAANGGASTTFSAQAVQQLPGQPEQVGTIIKSGQDMRLEFEQNGQQVVQIFRPSAGVMRMLFPANKTYMEFNGPAMPAKVVDEQSNPCPPKEAKGVTCVRKGEETVNGVEAQRWVITAPQQPKPTVIVWDPLRHQALRQEFPNGGVMKMSFKAMEDHAGRRVEHWTTETAMPGQKALSGEWWFDPGLRMVVREQLPNGVVRYLQDIKAGPVDPALFEAPSGWRKVDPPRGQGAPNRPQNGPYGR